MTASRLAPLFALTLITSAQDQGLNVLRVVPIGEAEPTTAVEVTFDRPVIGMVEEAVDPKAIFRIEPAVEGIVEWRDPITVRFTPARSLTPGTSYTVTIANTFQALDGSRLARPYQFTFRVLGPRVLFGTPVGPYNNPKFLGRDAKFDLLVSHPVDLELVSRRVHLEFSRACRGANEIRLQATRQRAVTKDDPRQFESLSRRAGGSEDLARVVELEPANPLPYGCSGFLALPKRMDASSRVDQKWPFATFGALRVAGVRCPSREWCPTGPILLELSTPVRGVDVVKHVRVEPEVSFTVDDTTRVSERWMLDAPLEPRSEYVVTVAGALADIFDQRLGEDVTFSLRTTGYRPAITYAYGHLLVERDGYRTFAVQHVNVDTLLLRLAPIPDSLEHEILEDRWLWGGRWQEFLNGWDGRAMPVVGKADQRFMTGVKIPIPDVRQPGQSSLYAVQVTSPALDSRQRYPPIAVVQVTDLAVHARIGAEDGAVWVTGVSDGQPRAGVEVALHDPQGRVRARAETDAQGLARFPPLAIDASAPRWRPFDGYVTATLGSDRGVTRVDAYDSELSAWQFRVAPAWGLNRRSGAAAVFTERDIYRPGEPVYAKALVRRGALGSLAPAKGDSLRWVFSDRENGTLFDTTAVLSEFGTADLTLHLPSELPLGRYAVTVEHRRDGEWLEVASTSYRVAEYRPPEFLVDVAGRGGPTFGGDSMRAAVEARYLFGAPMGRAAVSWVARQRSISAWEIDIPQTQGFIVGERGWWWEDAGEGGGLQIIARAEDTLDAGGRLDLAIAVPQPPRGRPARVTVEATVTDVNRQTGSASTSTVVHPASVYVGVRPEGESYFWTAGRERDLSVIIVRPDGRRVPGISVSGTLVRREWHRVRRMRDGVYDEVGEWVADTVGTCTPVSGPQPVPCRFTPPKGGQYVLTFKALDEEGREASTSFYRWAAGKDWVPWNDENEFRMDVIPDRSRYAVGDTASVLFATPFTDAEAWVTVERETILEQRRVRITSGTTTLKFPITEAHVPNTFISILVARGRHAPPGPVDDPGRPTIRVGYAEIRVAPEVKRLSVDVRPLRAEYRPGDTARVALRVTDSRGAGRRSEVTLWAVDEGVLALTGYETPDPIDLLYQPRALGVRLGSNLVSVAAQVAEAMTVKVSSGSGGGFDAEGILRSRFQTTAFFLGSVVTDGDGRAVASAPLPDNLTTFRVMAVAVTAGDRYGSGASELLVTRPLLARPALPRFLRAEDEFAAGVVVNHRLGGTPVVKVDALARDASLLGDASRTVTLEAGRGREVRFRFRGLPGDTATFRFKVSSGAEADAVETRLPVEPAYHPRAYTVTGVLRDEATAEFFLPAGIDPARSRLEVSFGTSPLALIRGFHRELRVYPYYCTEQVASVALPLIALVRAQRLLGTTLVPGNPRREIELAVRTISRRQRADGGIGLWSANDWTSPWLSTHAGRVLLGARSAGVAVDDSVLARLAEYVRRSLHEPEPVRSPLVRWYERSDIRLSERVAAVDLLSLLRTPDIPAENSLLSQASLLAWEDQLRLAAVLARRPAAGSAARSLLAAAWADVRVEGRRAVIPPRAHRAFYFYSTLRPAAQLLTATLAIEPEHPQIGPLVETVIQQGRAGRLSPWNTQDYAAVVAALVAYEEITRGAGERGIRIRHGNRVLVEAGDASGIVTDSSFGLTGLVTERADGASLRLQLDARRSGPPVFYYLTVHEVPRDRPVTPDQEGIEVERWYEDFETGKPLTRVQEGELVRVRLRIRVPAERHFVVVDDPLPAGLEAVDLSLRTTGTLPRADQAARERHEGEYADDFRGYFGYWDYGWWSPFDHREMRDDRVIYFATILWKGTYTASYVARATTPGTFVRPPVHAEEMYNPAVHGRSDGGTFTVTARP